MEVLQRRKANLLLRVWNSGKDISKLPKPPEIVSACDVGKLEGECKNGNDSIPTSKTVPVSERIYVEEAGLCEVSATAERCPHICVRIFGTDYDALLDSGASVSVTSVSDIAERNGLTMKESPLRIVTADKTVHKSLGYVQLPIEFNGVTKVVPVLVVPQICRKMILGYNFWKAFGIQPMMEGAQGLEKVATLNRDSVAELEVIDFTILPIQAFPEIRKTEPDETLDIPALELPEPSKTTPETVETEHELLPEVRA